mgnify:CR=1 FL=1
MQKADMPQMPVSINFKKNPYRGVFTAVAREQGVTRSAVIQAYYLNNARVIELVLAKVRAIQQGIQEHRDAISTH